MAEDSLSLPIKLPHIRGISLYQQVDGWLARSSFMDGAAAAGGHGSSSEMMMVLDEIHNIFTDILVLSSGEDG